MAEKPKTPNKFKFINFAKVLGVCLGAVFGLIGVSLGIIALTGGFNPPHVALEELKFEQNIYVIDGNLEKNAKQDGNVYHIDYQTKVDEDENPIYETIRALPTNADCTELDATLQIKSGNSSIEIVTDENTKVFGQTEETDLEEWHDKFSIKLKSNIKIRPVKETKTFIDENGETFEREVNKGGWTLLRVEQGTHIAFCFVFVDVPVYEYQIAVQSQDGLVAYQPTGDETEEDFVPDYLVDNTDANGYQYTFSVKNGTVIPEKCFDTVYNANPAQGYTEQKLLFNFGTERRNLYSKVFKEITYVSSNPNVAQVIPNLNNNTATIKILPNSYGATFEIYSYVLPTYKSQYQVLDSESFEDLKKYSLNTIKFQVNEIELETFEVSQNPINYYVFEESQILLTRAGSSKANFKSDDVSYYNFAIELNQHFNWDAEQSILDEYLKNTTVVAGYKTTDGEFVEYDEEDGAVFVKVDDFGAKRLVVNKQDKNLKYLKFEYKADEESEVAYQVFCPIQFLVHNASVSISKSKLDLKYYKKPVDGETNSNNIIDFENLKEWENEYNLNVRINSEDGQLTYSKIMYFINFASDSQFVQVDANKKINISGDDFYALSYDVEAQDDEEFINHIAKVTDSGLNARLVVAIVKTSLPNGQGEVLVNDDGYIEYHAIATYTSNAPQFVAVSAEQQFEIDKCVLVVGNIETLDLKSEEFATNVIDLYGTTENPVLSLSKLDSDNHNTYVTFVMTYYGAKNDNSNFFADFTKLNGVVTSSSTSEIEENAQYDAESIYCLTFTANTNGTAIVSIQALSNPVWGKTITFNVTEDIIKTLVLTNDDAQDNVVEATYSVNTNKITFDDIEFDLQIEPSDSQASTTFARAFSFTQVFKESLCDQLDIDISSATTKEIINKLNLAQYESVRKSLGDLVADSDVVDIGSYKSLDNKLYAKITAGGEALVVVFAMTNNQINLASQAFVIRVPEFELDSPSFEQEKIYRTLGNVNNNLVRITGGMNDGIFASTTGTSYNIQANNQFTLNGGAIDFAILKFAFENGETTSGNGSTISNGIITFGAVDEKLTEKLYAYIGSNLASNFCKFEMRFVLDPDYKAVVANDTVSANANVYVDLFELIETEIDGVLQNVPSIIVTNKDENKLFLPYNYNVANLEHFGEGFLQKFYYADAGGAEYYHIYKTLTFAGDIVSGNVVAGKVKFARSGVVDVVATGSQAGFVVAKINIDVIDAPDVVEPNFTDITFDEDGVSINEHIVFIPDSAVVELTGILFDIETLNGNENYLNFVIFRQENGVLIGDANYMGMQMSFNLLQITESDGEYMLSKANNYDDAKSLLKNFGFQNFEFDIIVGYSYNDQADSSNITVTINLAE